MFENVLVAQGGPRRQAAMTLAAGVAQCLLLGGLVIASVVAVPLLPRAVLAVSLIGPPLPQRTQPAAPAAASAATSSSAVPRNFAFSPRIVPLASMPAEEVAVEAMQPGPLMPGSSSTQGFLAGPPGFADHMASAPPPPPAPTPTPAPAPQRIRMSSTISAARLVHSVQPVYPSIAKQTGTQGTVLLAAVIARDGSIQELRALSGHPLLVRAALEAVRQWRYQPTLLNGTAVEVATSIEVRFLLR